MTTNRCPHEDELLTCRRPPIFSKSFSCSDILPSRTSQTRGRLPPGSDRQRLRRTRQLDVHNRESSRQNGRA